MCLTMKKMEAGGRGKFEDRANKLASKHAKPRKVVAVASTSSTYYIREKEASFKLILRDGGLST